MNDTLSPPTTAAGLAPSSRVLAGAAFAFSGVAALVYQVAWQRILALQTGVGIQSVAIITSAFMAGLGLGSLAGGSLSARCSPGTALRLFALLEGGIGLFAAGSGFVYYDWLALGAPHLFAQPFRAGVVQFLSLLAPTALMGMSLPFLVRALVRRLEGASRTIGYLYGINVLGAAAGALLTPWVLIRLTGIRGAIFAGVACNALAALGALLLHGRLAREQPEPDAEPAGAPAEPLDEPRRPFALWLALYATSGFCALGLEIVWFRIMDLGAKGSAFTFGTLLALYLLGLGGGSLIGARLVERLKSPLRAFLLCQCALLFYAVAVVALVGAVSVAAPGYDWYFQYWKKTQGFLLGQRWDVGTIVRLYLVWPVLLFGPPTLLMGLSFTVLQKAVHDDPRTSGRKVGYLQAANIAGCAAGSLAVGLVLLEAVGTLGTVQALCAVGVAFALAGAGWYGLRTPFLPLGAALVLVALAVPGQAAFWTRLHGQHGTPGFVAEDATSVNAILPEGEKWRVWVNGRSHSWIPFGGIHTRLGAMPALVHPGPVDVAIVGLGSGDTAWAASCRAETRSITVFELAAPQLGLLRRLAETQQPRHLGSFLADPRLQVVVSDGRHRLLHDDRQYDLIEADPLVPSAAYSGNLYSEDFFALAARRLRPGGVMCTWAPTPRIKASFAKVFPSVLAFEGGAVLVGSQQPLAHDPALWLQRAVTPHVRRHLGPANAGDVVRNLETGRAFDPSSVRVSAVNTDLFPRDEYASPE